MKLTLPPLLLLVFLLSSCGDDTEPQPYALILDEQGLKNSARIIGDTEGNAVIMSVINEDGNEDIRVRKMNPEGHILWERTYGTSSDDVANTIIQTSDENFLLGGFTLDQSTYDHDFYLLKLDTDGNVLWEKIFGNDDPSRNLVSLDQIDNLYEGEDGTLYLAILAQNLDRNGVFGPGIMALDAEGELLWQQAYFEFGMSLSSILVSNEQIFIFDRTNLIVTDLFGNTRNTTKLLDNRGTYNPGMLPFNDDLLTASRNRVFSMTHQGEIARELFLDSNVRIARLRETSFGYALAGYIQENNSTSPVVFLINNDLELIDEKVFQANSHAEMSDAFNVGDRIFSVGHFRPAQGTPTKMFLEIF